MEAVDITSLIAALPPQASCTVAFFDIPPLPEQRAKWAEIPGEYAADTLSRMTDHSLVFALPLPQLGCLMGEGVFKAAILALEGWGELIAKGKTGWTAEATPFEWKGARCRSVMLMTGR